MCTDHTVLYSILVFIMIQCAASLYLMCNIIQGHHGVRMNKMFNQQSRNYVGRRVLAFMFRYEFTKLFNLSNLSFIINFETGLPILGDCYE